MKTVFTTLAATLMLAAPAFAQQQCAPILAMLEALQGEYGEHMHSRGFDASGNMVAMFGSVQTGTWTALVTRPDGTACIVAHGGDFAVYAAPATGEEM